MDALDNHMPVAGAMDFLENPDETFSVGSLVDEVREKRKNDFADDHQNTPKKAKQVREICRDQDPGFDLITYAKNKLEAGLDAIEKMPFCSRDKQTHLAKEFSESVFNKASGDFLGSAHDSPRKQSCQAASMRGSSWVSPLLTRLKKVAPDNVQGKPLAVDHITKFNGQGLHLCEATSPMWSRLTGRVTNLSNQVYSATILGDQAKYSTFWRLGISDRDLVRMNEAVTSILFNENKELVKSVDVHTFKEVHAIRYHRGYTVASFFPVLNYREVSQDRPAEEMALHLELDAPVPIRLKVSTTAVELIDYAKGVVTRCEDIEFKDSKTGTVIIDCSAHYHMKGMPPDLKKGILVQFNAIEVGFKFPKAKKQKAERVRGPFFGSSAASASAMTPLTPDFPEMDDVRRTLTRSPMPPRALVMPSDDEDEITFA